MRTGSLIATVGVILAVAKIIFTWMSVLVMTANRVISLAVPAVVLIAIKGGSGLGTLSIPAKSRMSPLFVATMPIPLVQSWELPPPRLTSMSHLFSVYTFKPSRTFRSVGFGSAPP